MSFSGWCCQYCTGVDAVASFGGRKVIEGSPQSPVWKSDAQDIKKLQKFTIK